MSALPQPEAIASHRPLDDEEPLLPVAGPFMATNDALTSWAMNAAPGRVCVYARVSRLARGGVGERARQLQLAGLVTLLPQRRAIAGMFDYRARRTVAPFCGGTALPDDSTLKGEEALLHDMIVRLADDGAPCPPNRDLAAMLGVRHEERVSRMLGRLQQRKLIAIRFVAGPAAPIRVVDVVATGRSTQEPGNG